MSTVTISPKYQIVIPKEVRERLQFRPGQKLTMVIVEGVVRLVPVPELKDLRGLGTGPVPEDYREEWEEPRP